MAVRFAVKTGNWSDTTTWDSGALPVAGDTVYPNGFTVTLDQDINVDGLNNNISNVYLPNMAIPKMTSNTQPSGIVTANIGSTNNWYAFDQDSTTLWSSNVNNSGFIVYQFPVAKTIKRYRFTSTGNGVPKNFTFDGSNDGTTWTQIELISNNTTTYLSGATVAANTTAYLYYRLNVTAAQTITNPVYLNSFEMTESVGTVYGATTGGSFTVPASLSGTRNITFSGDGIVMGSTASTMITTNHNGGNIVNFNKTPGAYIIGPSWHSTATTYYGINHQGTAGGVINYNGDLYGSQVVSAANAGASLAIWSSAGATTLNINGKIYGAKGGGSSNTLYLLNSGTVVNIIGDLVPNNTIASPCITNSGTNTISITGSIISDIGSGISSTSSTCYLTIVGNIGYTNASSIQAITLGGTSTLNLTGTITAPPNANAIVTNSSGTITITGALTSSNIGACIASTINTGTSAINITTGIITAGTGVNAIYAPSSTLVTTGVSPLINSNSYMAVYAPRIRFYTGAQVEWTFQTSTGGTKILRNADGSSGLPSYIHVKIGQPFGPNRDIIGACVIPPANAVGVGIPVSAITPVDDPVPVIVGTLQLTGEDLLNAISTSSNVVATRLKNVATVETTGDQLAAFNRI